MNVELVLDGTYSIRSQDGSISSGEFRIRILMLGKGGALSKYCLSCAGSVIPV